MEVDGTKDSDLIFDIKSNMSPNVWFASFSLYTIGLSGGNFSKHICILLSPWNIGAREELKCFEVCVLYL